ncbi:hypothetical protein NFI96_004106 [Prochilodus magdalenae]|nr:hypothetical protein NFI96_004106 [Prochilodus magdalenae]
MISWEILSGSRLTQGNEVKQVPFIVSGGQKSFLKKKLQDVSYCTVCRPTDMYVSIHQFFISPPGVTIALLTTITTSTANVNTVIPLNASTTGNSTATPESLNNATSDPCNVYRVLYDDWRGTSSLNNTRVRGFDDTLVEWSGWYRLYLQGKSAQIPESNWCWSYMTCGGYTSLLLGGSHPLPQDGIVTREVYGTYVYTVDSRWYNSYRSKSIQVKTCPGNYYVYRLVKPAVSIPVPTYCAVVFDSPTYDPCNNYTSLNQPWRGTNETGGSFCDSNFISTGWYRLLYNGMNIRMPESCVNRSRCGTDITLWLNGSHPQIEDGIVTRGVCGNSGSDCCYFSSTPIRVKSCPGNYYVYEFVRPFTCNSVYCAAADLSDPCNNYTALDQPWRGTNATGLWVCDRNFNWIGWYRLLYYGMNIRMPESCVNEYRCGASITLWLNGSHPQIQDGIVTRGVCGRSGSVCCYYSSTSIRVKACPGNYYIYEFVRPTVCYSTYCADVNTIIPLNASTTGNSTATPESLNNATSDPCNVYRVLYDDWRGTSSLNNTSVRGFDDTLVEWSGWYRLYLQGKSAQIPESNWCWSYMTCGGYTSLLLGGSHPLPQDGIVTREVYGTYVYTVDSRWYNSYRSKSIQVKACPGNFYVYRLVKPAVSIPVPTYCAVVFDSPTYDPCNNYTSLNQPWRGTNETGGSFCDSNFISTGWYRLLYNGMNIRMPESCVNRSRCGTDITLWLNGSHPQIEDGIVTRGVCGNSGSDCCYFSSTPIRVKSCPENYYVYEFVRPFTCNSVYCADPNITVSEDCKINFTSKCGEDLFNQLENITAQVLPPQVVTKYLDMVLNAQDQLLKVEAASPDKLASIGNTVLNRTEKLVSTLVKPTETTDSVNISLNGLDLQVFVVGPKAYLNEIPQLRINSTQMEIDLIQISENNNGSAAAAFMSFTSMATMLKPSFFNTSNNTVKTMMSMVVSATLPKTTNTKLTTPVNFTLEHITELDPNGTLSCVYWNNTEWIVDGCELLQTNISHSVCSCVHLSTFALIMQVNPPPPGDNSDPLLELLSMVAVGVGLLFLSLSLLTFALCQQNLKVNVVPRINLCISLFLAHLLFILTQEFLQYIRADQLMCAVLAGVLHFLFLSAFVWMFIEAVLLLISVKNLTKIKSMQRNVLGWKCLIVIGYVIPLVVVGVSVGLFPDGYGSEQCWIKTDRNFVWSFLGPVCFIITLNFIFFIVIILTLRNTMAQVNSKSSQIKQLRTLVFKTLIQIVILGCPWILGFFTQGSKVLEIVFLFLNSQQGTFIFLVYCVLNQEVCKHYWDLYKVFSQEKSKLMLPHRPYGH